MTRHFTDQRSTAVYRWRRVSTTGGLTHKRLLLTLMISTLILLTPAVPKCEVPRDSVGELGLELVSFDGKYATYGRLHWTENWVDLDWYAVAVLDIEAETYRVIDTIPQGVERPIFCARDAVAYFLEDSTSLSLNVRKFLSPKTDTVLFRHVIGDTANDWLQSFVKPGSFDIALDHQLLAHEVLGTIEIRDFSGGGDPVLVGRIQNAMWPSISHDGARVYGTRSETDSLGNAWHSLISWDIDSRESHLLLKTNNLINLWARSASIETGVYYNAYDSLDFAWNVWRLDPDGSVNRVTSFKDCSGVYLFWLTEDGVVIWADDHSLDVADHVIRLIPFND